MRHSSTPAVTHTDALDPAVGWRSASTPVPSCKIACRLSLLSLPLAATEASQGMAAAWARAASAARWRGGGRAAAAPAAAAVAPAADGAAAAAGRRILRQRGAAGSHGSQAAGGPAHQSLHARRVCDAGHGRLQSYRHQLPVPLLPVPRRHIPPQVHPCVNPRSPAHPTPRLPHLRGVCVEPTATSCCGPADTPHKILAPLPIALTRTLSLSHRHAATIPLLHMGTPSAPKHTHTGTTFWPTKASGGPPAASLLCAPRPWYRR